MMTKKDFEILAKALGDAPGAYFPTYRAVAEELARHYPHFRPEIFLERCAKMALTGE